ncbi:MAG: helix-turn-helix transcriptional regulator [Chloroflexi bacterium]|uniref:ArsR/SmtB family transcription factor n=1 Tax=Candidatus Flexifilum breve TaxID=3140694 RepID=UPI003136CF9D|nr:helix-turn-helix transcriptional regulator [Chloroflexota bacterium]
MKQKQELNDLYCEDAVIHPEQVAHARLHLIDGDNALKLADFFKMLGDPTRFASCRRWRIQNCVYDIAAVVGISQSAVSHQLRLLRTAGLVKPRKSGKHVMYTLDDHHVSELFRCGLEHISHR